MTPHNLGAESRTRTMLSCFGAFVVIGLLALWMGRLSGNDGAHICDESVTPGEEPSDPTESGLSTGHVRESPEVADLPRMRISQASGELTTIRVVNPAGCPVADANVHVVDDSPERRERIRAAERAGGCNSLCDRIVASGLSLRTGADGRASVQVVGGRFQAYGEHGALSGSVIVSRARTGEEYRLVLRPGNTLQVVLGDDGDRAVSGVSIVAWWGPDAGADIGVPRFALLGQTDSNGMLVYRDWQRMWRGLEAAIPRATSGLRVGPMFVGCGIERSVLVSADVMNRLALTCPRPIRVHTEPVVEGVHGVLDGAIVTLGAGVDTRAVVKSGRCSFLVAAGHACAWRVEIGSVRWGTGFINVAREDEAVVMLECRETARITATLNGVPAAALVQVEFCPKGCPPRKIETRSTELGTVAFTVACDEVDGPVRFLVPGLVWQSTLPPLSAGATVDLGALAPALPAFATLHVVDRDGKAIDAIATLAEPSQALLPPALILRTGSGAFEVRASPRQSVLVTIDASGFVSETIRVDAGERLVTLAAPTECAIRVRVPLDVEPSALELRIQAHWDETSGRWEEGRSWLPLRPVQPGSRGDTRVRAHG